MSRTTAVRSLAALAVDRRPLAVPAFRRLWVASVVSAVGGSFSVVAVPAQVFAIGRSSAAVGAAGAVSFVALVVGALWSGAVADVRDRRGVLLVANCGLAATYAALGAYALVGGGLIAVLMVLVGCQGLAFGAIMTTMGAAVPRLVPVELLPAANSLTSLVRYAGAVLGPLLAGLLMPLTGLGALYLCDAVALLAVVRAVARLPPLRPRAPGPYDRVGSRAPHGLVPHIPPGLAPPAPLGILRQVTTGFRYLAASRLLLAVLGVDLAAMVFGMPVALFPELARDVYGGPDGGGPALGLLFAAYPVGVCCVALLSGAFTRAERHGTVMAAAAIAWGGTVVFLGLAAELWLALIALVLGGAVNFLLSTFRNAITQAHTDDALRGRVQGALTVVLIGGPQVANFVHGAAGALIGPRLAVCGGGLLTMVTVAAIARAVPELRCYRATG